MSMTRKMTIIAAVLLASVSCNKDRLDVDPVNEFLSENFYSTEDQVFSALVAAYDPLGWTMAYGQWISSVMFGEIRSDNANAGGDASNNDQPGWQESKKLAGRPYAAVTSGLAYHDDAISLRDASLENRENMVRLLNSYITSLINLRDEIEDQDRDALLMRLENSWNGRVRWVDERVKADWLDMAGEKVDGQSFGERMGQILFGSSISKRSKQRK